MLSIALCAFAFVVAFAAGRRSLVAGLVTVLGVGYVYGIMRANVLETFSHFTFDAAVIGLYCAQLSGRAPQALRVKTADLTFWIGLLMVYPTLLILAPLQDLMIELVGLRGNIFLLPFLLLGARLKGSEMYTLALWVAVLNLAAGALAVVQFFVGVEPFFPVSPVTAILYRSNDLADYTAFRIPSSFTNAHVYAGTMVISLPLLAGAWVQKHTARWPSLLLLAAITMSMVAVFMAASRSHALVLFAVTLATLFSGGLRSRRFGWIVAVAAVAWVVSGDERLQRFRTLEDTEFVTQRIALSVNMGFFELAREFPLGNGLGGGGTSIPYFLQGRLRRPVRMESEYARIVLEQGLPGLALWIAFIIWVFTRRPVPRSDPWFLGRRLARVATGAYFCSGLIGIGLLTAIPHTGLFLLLTGWIAVPPDVEDQQEQPEPALDMTTLPIASQHESTA